MNKLTVVIRIFILVLILVPSSLKAQIAINTTEELADSSAILDISSTNKGLLLPRMSSNDRISIGSPATGLLLFDTDNAQGFQYNQGTPSTPEWTQLGGTGAIDTTLFDNRIPMDSVGNGLPPFTISEPGSYYFTKDIIVDSAGIDGITITTNNVTLDLNGFSFLYTAPDNGDFFTDYGISVASNKQNIVIQNGIIDGWEGDGVYAFNSDHCIFRNLQVSNNGLDGLHGDGSSMAINVLASNNGQIGITLDNSSIITNCTASNNGEYGFEVRSDCIISKSVAYNNKWSGYKVQNDCNIKDCNSYSNERHGFQTGIGCHVLRSNANGNGGNGFYMSSSGVLYDSKASENGYCINDPNCAITPNDSEVSSYVAYGNGVRCLSNVQIVNCTFSDNERTGIRVSSADCFVSNNHLINNKNVGVYSTVQGSFFANNFCQGNGANPSPNFVDPSTGSVVSGNYELVTGSTFAPIVNVNGAGDISTVSNGDNPFANFEY